MLQRQLLLAIACLSAICISAQEGIDFSHGSWKEILEKAKQENKLVFVDVFTSWCGPCKKMAAEVFTRKDVGDTFNASFVNYKIDAEKGEGRAIAKYFDVKAYPTYLFVNGDGELVYRSIGYNESKIFLQEAAIANREKNDPKPFARWQNEFNKGKRDRNFFIGYLAKRATLKLPSADVLEEAFPYLNKEDLKSKAILSTLFFSDPAYAIVPGGDFYEYITRNHNEVDSILGKPKQFSLHILQMATLNYFRKNIIPDKRNEMLPVMLSSSRQLSLLLQLEDSIVTSKWLVMLYYSGVENEDQTANAAMDYVQNGLLKMNIKRMMEEDENDYLHFREPFEKGSADSTKLANWDLLNRLNKHRRLSSFSYKLREAAEIIYKASRNKMLLAKAANWAQQANEYFPHFSNEAVYAGLLFKMSKKDKAIGCMQHACKDPILKSNPDVAKLLISNVERMQKGTMPENLWKL